MEKGHQHYYLYLHWFQPHSFCSKCPKIDTVQHSVTSKVSPYIIHTCTEYYQNLLYQSLQYVSTCPIMLQWVRLFTASSTSASSGCLNLEITWPAPSATMPPLTAYSTGYARTIWFVCFLTSKKCTTLLSGTTSFTNFTNGHNMGACHFLFNPFSRTGVFNITLAMSCLTAM